MLSARLLGRRVVLRYRRSDGVVPPLSDVVGELVSLTDGAAVVAGPSGPVTVERAAVVAARAVAPHRREILELQRIARLGWRAAEVAELDGWQLHADQGWTGRANSVLPLTTPHRPLPALLAEAGRFYAERGLPLRIQVPLPARGLLDAELAGRCWTIQRPTVVLTMPTTGPAGPPSGGRLPHGDLPHGQLPRGDEVSLAEAPSTAWLDGYQGGRLPEHAVDLLTRHDQVRFASVRRAGAMAGVARATVDEGWLGITAVEVAPRHRRSGVGSALIAALLAWGRSCGAGNCYLQVETDNSAALAFYERLGFIEHHRYHYRLAPTEGSCES